MKKITYYGNTNDFKKQELLIQIFPIYEKKCKVNSVCTNTLLLMTLSCSTTVLLVSDYLSQEIQEYDIIK